MTDSQGTVNKSEKKEVIRRLHSRQIMRKPDANFEKPILVLDLDETLIHYDKETGKLKRRPHLKYFLHDVSKSWVIVVFTASV